jgi:hypothetical protein
VTRAMGHSPNGQDAKRLEAKPEWPGLAEGEMRPETFAEWLLRISPIAKRLNEQSKFDTRQTRKEGDK